MKNLATYLSEKLVVNKEFRNLDNYNIYSKIDKILSSVMDNAEPTGMSFKQFIGFKLPDTKQNEKKFNKITKLISDAIISKDNTLFYNNAEVLDHLRNSNNVIFRFIHYKNGCQIIKKLSDNKYILITLYQGARIEILKDLKSINFENSTQYNCPIDIFYDILEYVYEKNLSPNSIYVNNIKNLLNQQ